MKSKLTEIKLERRTPNERLCVIAAVPPQIIQCKLASYYPAASSVEAAASPSRHYVVCNPRATECKLTEPRKTKIFLTK
jgi:hypothetical protein